MNNTTIWILGIIAVLLALGWMWSRSDGTMKESPPFPNKWILSEAEWKKRLTPEQFRVLRKKGTEKAFTGKYDKWKEKGIYVCAACELPLFSSEAKYDSGTGWPSFWEPIKPENVYYKDDDGLFVKRVEVLCSRCDSHIGHVFDDGPPPTGKRYCMNSISLKFIPENEVNKP